MALWATNLENLKRHIGITVSAADDARLEDLIEEVQEEINSYCNRNFELPSADVTETYSGGVRTLSVDRWPIASITSIKEAGDWDFTNATALTANEGYRARNADGLIRRVGTEWLAGFDTVQVVYSGGYVADGGTVGSGETALPRDLHLAALLQCEHMYRNHEYFGKLNVSITGNTAGVSTAAILPQVRTVLDRYRRLASG